jgi:hypothetical protein
MRRVGVLLWTCVALAAAAPACAGAPERDKAWGELVAQAKAHGAGETKLDRSASYVFQREDGSYLTFTRPLATDKGRSICLIAKDLTATACIDWDSGQLKLGRRADAATPWKFYSFASLDEFEKAKPGFLDELTSSVNKLLVGGEKHGSHAGSGCYRVSQNGVFYRVPSVSC